MTQTVFISVVVRCFNSEKTLPRLLDGLDLQAADEVIVVDSGSRDKTVEVARARGARVLDAPPPFNYSKSLNIGFRAARHPWVLVISSHTVPLIPDLLGVYRAAAASLPDDVAVIYGPNSTTGFTKLDGQPMTYFRDPVPPVIFAHCGNGNTLYRLSAWQQLPFDETIRTTEDKIWLEVALQHGFRGSFLPAARTINISVYALAYMFRKGYSDQRSGTGRRMTLWQLFLSLGSHTKPFVSGKMSFGNWIRYTFHIFGRYCGSYRPQDNRPNP
jgi:glycosyltransferase involved in cell wall biosynthesis